MADSTASTANPSADEPLGPEVWRTAIAVIVGVFMSILDLTIVNVALRDLGTDLHATGFDQIQWVMTAYMLAVAAVIPVTGWASDRLGGKRLFLTSLVMFTIASAACALAWSVLSLVVFRVIQGLAGGALMPSGQILLARAAGTQRMGRIMSVIGVPMLLAPVLGPVIGGLILNSFSWHWIFLVNVPVGIVGFFVAQRFLQPDNREGTAQHAKDHPLDWFGLVTLGAGVPLVVYGMANIAGSGIGADRSWGPIVAGVILIAVFVWHALHRKDPLLDVGLFRNRSYSLASFTFFALGAFLFGSIILLPLYYQIGRGEDVLSTGLLLAPQGLGAALGITLTGRLVDRIGGGIVVIGGLVVLLIGTLPFTQLGPDTSYWYLSAAMFVRGIGFGSTMMPAMAAAYATLKPSDISHATPQLNVIRQLGGSVGAALLATILQEKFVDALGGFGDKASLGEGSAGNLQALPAQLAGPVSHAFGSTFWWVMAGTAIAMVPAIFLARDERAVRRERAREAALGAGGDVAPSEADAVHAHAGVME